MTGKITFLHTVPSVRDFLKEYASKLFFEPPREIIHIVQPGLLEIVGDNLHKESSSFGEFSDVIHPLLQENGAILVTCSSLGDLVVQFRKAFPDALLFRIDEPMAYEAVSKATNIGLVVTNQTTIAPSSHLMQCAAQKMGKHISVSCLNCKDDLNSLVESPNNEERRAILAKLNETFSNFDLVVLAQVSVAKIISEQEFNFSVPVLKSYVTGLEQLRMCQCFPR
jgi:hypothetical protein